MGNSGIFPTGDWCHFQVLGTKRPFSHDHQGGERYYLLAFLCGQSFVAGKFCCYWHESELPGDPDPSHSALACPVRDDQTCLDGGTMGSKDCEVLGEQ